MTALDRAVALAEMDHVPVSVGEDLHLDVARVFEVALHVHGRVGEVGLALPPSGLEGPLGLGRVVHDPEALAPATGRCLDRDRPPELLAEAQNVIGRGDRLRRPRDNGNTGRRHPRAGGGLRAHHLDRVRGRADPDEAGSLDRSSEPGVLGEEPIAGMDRLRSGASRDLEQTLLVEVTLGGRARADQVRLVGHGDMEGAPVGLRVDGDRSDPKLAEGAKDANGDLSAIGHENFREGRHGPYSPCG